MRRYCEIAIVLLWIYIAVESLCDWFPKKTKMSEHAQNRACEMWACEM